MLKTFKTNIMMRLLKCQMMVQRFNLKKAKINKIWSKNKNNKYIVLNF